MRVRVVLSALSASLFAVLAARARPAAAQTASAGNVNLRMVHFPEGVTKVRAVIAFTSRGIATGWANGAPFKGLAKRLEAAIVMVRGGDDLNDHSYPNRCASGEFNGIREALTKLGDGQQPPRAGQRPDGGHRALARRRLLELVQRLPPRADGDGVRARQRRRQLQRRRLKVPVLYELGTGDLIENGSKKPRAGMFVNRGKGAPMALVIGQGEGHNNVTADSLDMVIDIIEAICQAARPRRRRPQPRARCKLNDIDEMSGSYWLGNLYTKEIAPYGDVHGRQGADRVPAQRGRWP